MPLSWDGGTVTFTLQAFHGTTETITWSADVSAQCVSGTDTESSTWGTTQQGDVNITTANRDVFATTAALTPNGTCIGGGSLNWRYVINTGRGNANAANTKILGVSLTYSLA